MEIEIKTTKKKISKSIIDQMQMASAQDMKSGVCLGYVIGCKKDSYKTAIIKHGDDYFTCNLSWKKGGGMRALSIRQPWASLIISGIKPVENRTWKSSYRGPLLIHAGKNMDMEAYNWLKSDVGVKKVVRGSIFLRGGIIGKVNMIDCVEAYESEWFEGPYGFVFEKPEKIKLYPVNGKLSFFDVDWEDE